MKYYEQYTDMRKGTDAQNLSAELFYGWQKFYAGSTDLLLQVEKKGFEIFSYLQS